MKDEESNNTVTEPYRESTLEKNTRLLFIQLSESLEKVNLDISSCIISQKNTLDADKLHQLRNSKKIIETTIRICQIRIKTVEKESSKSLEEIHESLSDRINSAKEQIIEANRSEPNPYLADIFHKFSKIESLLEEIRKNFFLRKAIKTTHKSEYETTEKYSKEIKEQLKASIEELRSELLISVKHLHEQQENINNKFKEETATHTEILKKSIESEVTKTESKIIEIRKIAENSSETSDKKIEDFFKKHQSTLAKKEQEFAELTGKAANYAVVGEHLEAAQRERKSADWLRGASLFCMFCIAVIVVASILEPWLVQNYEFDLEESIQRVLGLFTLTIPAAYLARESNKHRQQQYAYHQTALDLKALDPFIGTMPEDEQHAVKKDMVNRIFAQKDFSNFGQDNYPVNVHELLMAVLSKVETPKNTSTEKPSQEKPSTEETTK